MASMNLFTPRGTYSITSAVSSARVVVNTAGCNQLRFKNADTTNFAYAAWGDITITASVPNGATAGSFPIGPGETTGVSIPSGVTNVAVICSAGTPLLLITPGNGV